MPQVSAIETYQLSAVKIRKHEEVLCFRAEAMSQVKPLPTALFNGVGVLFLQGLETDGIETAGAGDYLILLEQLRYFWMVSVG